MKRAAAIDLGSNTVRLLVAKSDGQVLENIYSGQKITRLGEKLGETGKLSTAAISRTADAIEKMIAESGIDKTTPLRIFATSAARVAKNSGLLADEIYKKTGLKLEIIDQQYEAMLSLKGAQLALGETKKDFMLFDIGGGSTEFIRLKKDGTVLCHGTDLGVVRLTERYIKKAPTDKNEYTLMMAQIKEKIRNAFTATGNCAVIVGTAGTVTSIAAIALGMEKYDPSKINGYRLAKQKFRTIADDLLKKSLDERSAIAPINGGREDLIVAGIGIIETIFIQSGVDEIIVSDFGLREGILLEMADV